MTGYGVADTEFDRYSIRTEFKSLNNKFLELNIRMPKAWQGQETEIRRELGKLVERGSCVVAITITYKNTKDKVLPLNKDVATYYLNELSELIKPYNLSSKDIAGNIMNLPNLFQAAEDDQNEEDIKNLFHALNKGFNEFEKFRMKEGEVLSEELSRMTNKIKHVLGEIEQLDPERIESIRNKIDAEISQLKENNIDKNRFEQEMIYYLEKLDISEEKVRLLQHCNYFLETMKSGSSGKKLGFIAQEMGREINTIGSKANHFKIQQRVVEMKDELEKIKEQINNII